VFCINDCIVSDASSVGLGLEENTVFPDFNLCVMRITEKPSSVILDEETTSVFPTPFILREDENVWDEGDTPRFHPSPFCSKTPKNGIDTEF
jgi:hypothetical protein